MTHRRLFFSLQVGRGRVIPEINADSGVSRSANGPPRWDGPLGGTGPANSCVQILLCCSARAAHWHGSHHRESEQPSRSVSLPLQRSLLQRAGGVWTSARNGRGGRAENWQLKTTETVGCPRPSWRQPPRFQRPGVERERQAAQTGQTGQTDTSRGDLLTSAGVTAALWWEGLQGDYGSHVTTDSACFGGGALIKDTSHTRGDINDDTHTHTHI